MVEIINKQAPEFKAKAFVNGSFKEINLNDYKGKWVVLFFYPADFTFVCPTELKELGEKYEKFREINSEILSVSTDTEFVHKAWHENSDLIKGISFPMVADPSGKISRDYGTYIEEEGLSIRATFIIDPDGVVKSVEMNDNGIGRNANETIRKIQALQFVREHGNEVCPASWEPGKESLKVR